MPRNLSLLALVVLLCAHATLRAAPNVTSVDLHGLQIGKVTRIRLSGADLNANPRLVASFPLEQKIVGVPAGNNVQFDVTVPITVVPGVYNLWLATDTGVSQKLLMALDALPQRPLTPKVTLPVAAHSTIQGSQQRQVNFAGKRGQRVMVSVEAKRLGSALRPVVQLFDPRNKLVAWSMPKPQFQGDVRLQVSLPSDGSYQVRVHDLEYAGRAPGFFRLKIGTWQVGDLAFPPIVSRQAKATTVALIGSKRQIQVQSAVKSSRIALAASPQASGPRPFVDVTDWPVAVEPMSGQKGPLQVPQTPGFACGRITGPDEVDKWSVAVSPGRYRFQVSAQVLGSPLDAFLQVLDVKGKVLGASDDSGGNADCLLDVNIPAATKRVVVSVRDRNNLGGEHYVYRLSVGPAGAVGLDQPRFNLSVDNFRVHVATGNRVAFRVRAIRQGYNGPIRLRFARLPAGVQVQAPTIPANQSGVLVTVSGTGYERSALVSQLIGSAEINGKLVEQVAQDPSQPGNVRQLGLRHQLIVGLGPRQGPAFDAFWSTSAVATPQLVLGSEAQLPVRGLRPPGSDGPIRLALVSSQQTIRDKRNRVQAARMLKLVRGTEVPVDKAAQTTFDAIAPLQKAATAASTKLASIQARTGPQVAAAQAERKRLVAANATARKALNAAMPGLTNAKAALTLQLRYSDAVNKALKKAVQTTTSRLTQAQTVLKEAEKKQAGRQRAVDANRRQQAQLSATLKKTKNAKERARLQQQLAAAGKQQPALTQQLAVATLDVRLAQVDTTVREKTHATVTAEARKLRTLSAAGVAKSRAAVEAIEKKIAPLRIQAEVTQKNLATANAKLTALMAKVKAEVDPAQKTATETQRKLTAARNSARDAARLARQQTTAVVAVPAALAEGGYMLTLRAELLSRDKKRVLATRTLPVRQYRVLRPFQVLVDKTKWSAKLNGKAVTATLSGRVVRQGGFRGVVTISASGLPKGVKAAGAAAANQQTFTLRITFNKNQKPANLNLKIFGTGRFSNKLPVVRSVEVPVTLTLAK